jgi:hypothetical protein
MLVACLGGDGSAGGEGGRARSRGGDHRRLAGGDEKSWGGM